jgi:hypothetical protein
VAILFAIAKLGGNIAQAIIVGASEARPIAFSATLKLP